MNRLLNLKQVTQKTKEWFNLRNEIITATDVSTILECNKFQTKKDLLDKKINLLEITSNEATEWGNFFEDVAVSIYSEINNVKIHEIGLLIHPKYNWLGASPDGVMDNNKLIEIKCPFSKKIFNKVPINYWIQTQIQMEVCNIEETVLFVCSFEKKKIDNTLFQGEKNGINWSLLNCKQFIIKRDSKWFKSNFSRLQDFYLDLSYYKKNGLNLKKRSLSSTRSNKYSKKLKIEYQDMKKWNNITSLINFHNNDKILDWLNIYGHKLYPKDKKTISHKFIEQKSKEFKTHVINYIKNSYPNKFIEITNQPDNFLTSNFLFKKTIDNLKHYPIIINGILHNQEYEIYGKIDLIVNSEYFNILTGRQLIGYDYALIKIEYSTLKFLKDKNFINSKLYHKNFMHIMNDCMIKNNFNSIGSLLGYKSNINNNCFESIGLIKNDSQKLDNALTWLKYLKNDGKNWSINPPTITELYPNMKNGKDYPWHKTKKRIALQNNEISLLTNCTLKERDNFHKNGIYSMNNINNQDYQSPILDLNFNSNKIFIPDRIENNFLNWKTCTKELYIDFETVNDLNKEYESFPEHNNNTYIYMIGIGYNNNGTWKYYNFTVDHINHESELQILNQMNNLLQTLDYDIIYHWSNAEINFLNGSNLRHQSNFKLDKNLDLLKMFKKEPICIKDLFDYKLKNVIKCMNKHKLIDIKWDEISDGLDAMILTWKYNKISLKNNIKLSQIKKFKSIIDYNEVDCKSMFEIVNYLKKYKI